jgi:hypothetical protein
MKNTPISRKNGKSRQDWQKPDRYGIPAGRSFAARSRGGGSAAQPRLDE